MTSKQTYGILYKQLQAPEGWMLEFHSECVDYSTRKYENDLDQPVLKRKGTFAGNCTNYSSVHEIELRSHYNGGGKNAFGGASQWPVVTSKIAFNSNEYALAVEFAQDLGAFINEWLKKKNR